MAEENREQVEMIEERIKARYVGAALRNAENPAAEFENLVQLAARSN